ncbi:unnamed protein product [Brachionus calyciflorus]|uniref:Uncharacterized protein n=1 Tax=Brachionus calyciflorus TaxID=104777 RepID=A0A814JYD5_9BILA|nr:unnamed protein product [Brachionus calyciflorus]
MKHNFHYVPILSSLKALLSHKQILENFLKESNECFPTNIRSFKDSECYKSNIFFKTNQNSNQIILYIDDFETSNPLGDCRKKQELCGVYYRIRNLHQKYKSKSRFTQLALIVKTDYLKKFGYGTVLEPLIRDLKKLENEGINVPNANGQLINFKGTISFLVSDN